MIATITRLHEEAFSAFLKELENHSGHLETESDKMQHDAMQMFEKGAQFAKQNVQFEILRQNLENKISNRLKLAVLKRKTAKNDRDMSTKTETSRRSKALTNSQVEAMDIVEEPVVANKIKARLRNQQSSLNQDKEALKVALKSNENKAVHASQTHEAKAFFRTELEKYLAFNPSASVHKLEEYKLQLQNQTIQAFPKANIEEIRSATNDYYAEMTSIKLKENEQEAVIGIDLGTTYSCAAIYQHGKIKILPNALGKFTTPSYISFLPSGVELIGEAAKKRAYENPEGTIYDCKRILGRRFDDKKLQDDMLLWPFKVIDGGHGIPMIEVRGERINPEIVSAKILKQIKIEAEQELKKPVNKAVITVPAYFTDGQKQATIDAGEMAGLEVLSILPEPVAAAMAYTLENTSLDEKYILVFDLGGGTFDVAILKSTKGKLDVITVDGDSHLGGEDFDKNLMNYCVQQFKTKHNIDLFEGKDSTVKAIRDEARRRLNRLQAVCEIQKLCLSQSRQVDIEINNIWNDIDMDVSITRTEFENINKSLFESTIDVVKKSVASAKLHKSQITDVILVGGSTRIPKVQDLLQSYFDGKRLDKKVNPDEAVAYGAGLMAAIKQGNVDKHSTLYTKVLDVNPMSIGVEVYGGAFSPIIPKGTKIPVKCLERYKTAHNCQTSVQITIFQGENTVALKNEHLGDFYLNGIPSNDAGVQNIDVEMVINDQGILHVTANCASTGHSSNIVVTENKQRMGRRAIERVLKHGI